MFEIETSTTVTSKMIADAITIAFRGACSEWLKSYHLPLQFETFGRKDWYANPKFWEQEGVRVDVTTHDGSPSYFFGINKIAIEKALQLLAEQYPTYFHDLTGDEGLDEDGADTFLQLVVFGSVQP